MNGIPHCARNDSTILLCGRGGKCGGGISTGSMTSRRVVIPSVARNLEQIQTH
jgi:ribulose 1,5-bisphosphate synthetase/thiazole synthase